MEQKTNTKSKGTIWRESSDYPSYPRLSYNF